MPQRYYPSLDGLRTIAVGIVLAAHGGMNYFRSGGIGVDLFFVLSGYLITSILAQESAQCGTISFRNFYARRFLRLGPALVVTCVFVAIARVALDGYLPTTEILISLTYTANWARALYNYDLNWLTHCWSLAIEEQFYLIWPVFILFFDRLLRSPRDKAAALVGLAALIAVYRAVNVGHYTDERINFGLDTRMDTLMLGAALAYGARALPDHGLPERWSKLLGRFLAPAALITLFVMINVVTWYSPWMGWCGYVIVAYLSAIIIGDLVLGRHSLLARPLAWGPIVYVGRISYGVYLLHLPVYYLVERALPTWSYGEKIWFKVPLSLGVAALSFHLVERYFLKLKTHFESGSSTRISAQRNRLPGAAVKST